MIKVTAINNLNCTTKRFTSLKLPKNQEKKIITEKTWQGIVVAQDLKVLAISRRPAISGHDPIKRLVSASESR